MGIQKDAGKVLLFLYKQKVSEQYPTYEEIVSETKWDAHRLGLAITYLVDKKLIMWYTMAGLPPPKFPSIGTYDVLPAGIDTVEDKGKFKKTFGFSVGFFGLFNFNYGASEK